MTATTPAVTINPELPDGVLHGYDATNALIVIVVQVNRVRGTEEDTHRVVRWDTSPEDARRIAAIAAWSELGHPCGARA